MYRKFLFTEKKEYLIQRLRGGEGGRGERPAASERVKEERTSLLKVYEGVGEVGRVRFWMLPSPSGSRVKAPPISSK